MTLKATNIRYTNYCPGLSYLGFSATRTQKQEFTYFSFSVVCPFIQNSSITPLKVHYLIKFCWLQKGMSADEPLPSFKNTHTHLADLYILNTSKTTHVTPFL